MKLPRTAILLGLMTAASPLAAEVFKCIDAAGKVTYGSSQEPKMKCTPVTAEITVVPAVKLQPLPVKEKDPKEAQREALENQIKEQELALGRAKKDLADQEGLRLLNEIHYQKKLDRLKPFQEKVAELEKALEQSRAELAQLK